jgi:NAD(P)-dependent dehydrogenase (short-subunit alcohol dehydrogenase family)
MKMAAQNKIALITGANRGIGLETARQLGQQGYTVLVAARSLEKAEGAVTELKTQGIERAVPLALDVSDDASVQAAAAEVTEKFGKLDALVNNAGIITGEEFFGNSVADVALDAIEETFDVNLLGVIRTTRAFLPLLEKSDAGRIVNLTSILGSLTLHATEDSPIYNSKSFAYNASKAALNMYTIHLAHALADTSIKVNAAHPGWVQTDMGGEQAPMDIVQGAKTSVDLATLGEDGPSGAYIHLGDTLPW